MTNIAISDIIKCAEQISDARHKFFTRKGEIFMMKLVFAIVNGDDANTVASELTNKGYIFTKLATKGGFLKAGNTTFLIGVEQTQVDDVVSTVREFSSKRVQHIPHLSAIPGEAISMPMEVEVGGATIFVTDVSRFEKF